MFEKQWIGLLDRDGVQICEGDTLWREIIIRETGYRTGNIYEGVVKYNSKATRFEFGGKPIGSHSYNDYKVTKKGNA